MKHFQHHLHNPNFHILTDHKPLIYAINSLNTQHSLRQAPQLDYISQFTTDLRHVHGVQNPVADALSRMRANVSMPSPTVPISELAQQQHTDVELQSYLKSPNSLNLVTETFNHVSLICDIFPSPPHSSSTAHSYLQTLSDHISKLKPCPPRAAFNQKPFVHPDLNSSHVFLQNDAVQRPLQQPYSGTSNRSPYKVLKQFSKTFIIDHSEKRQCVSKDRLKPAYLANNEQDQNINSSDGRVQQLRWPSGMERLSLEL